MSEEIIPTRWVKIDLDKVLLSIVGGGTPSKAKPNYYQGDIPWMSVKDMNKNVLEDTIDHISQEAVENSSTNVIPAGVPIIATRMSLGKIVVANFDTAINQDLKALFLPQQIDRNYLIWWYRSIARDIENLGTGTTVKGIRLEVLHKLQFPLAPIAEQRVIAEKLDTMLAQVESIKARLECIPEILNQFRQSVLADAVSGKLTEEWRTDLEVPLGKTVSLKDVVELNPKKPKIEDAVEVGFSPMAMAPEGINYELGFEVRTWGEVKKGFTVFQNEDVLLAKITPCFENGKSAIPQNLPNGYGAGSTEFMVLRCFKDKLLAKYLFLNISTTSFLVQGEVNMTGSVGHKRVPKEFVEDWKIYLPSICEQIEIIKKVEQLFKKALTTEQFVQLALNRVNNLTQSILAKAFRGELTAEWREANPNLISGENSVEALLERIKAERTLVKSATKRGGSK